MGSSVRSGLALLAFCIFTVCGAAHSFGQSATSAAPQAPAQSPADPVKILVDRLDLDRYRATVKGLTQFGDRRQGTERNRQAIDWI